MTRTAVFSVERRKDGVAVIHMNTPGQRVNLWRSQTAARFTGVLDELDADQAVRAAVFASETDLGFIGGADIDEVAACQTQMQAEALSRHGQLALARLIDLRLPVVAAIHGDCLGAGLELATACEARVASDDPTTRLGTPEVSMGLIPCTGGTVRLPQLIGLPRALELMLTGQQLHSDAALRAGLVDEVVPAPILIQVAAQRAALLAEHSEHERIRARLRRFVETSWPGRRVILERARKQARERANDDYPAPMRLIDVVQIGLQDGPDAGLLAEQRAFGELAMSPAAGSLLSLFQDRRTLRHETPPAAADAVPTRIERAGVLGAGMMGSAIAYVMSAQADLPVRLKDIDHSTVAAGIHRVERLFARAREAGDLSPLESRRRAFRVGGAIDYTGFDRCQLVIEAALEELPLKQQLLRDVERFGRDDIIFASNTSSLPIAEIARASAHPETVIGMHFLAPAQWIPLVEIVATPATAPWVVASCVELVRRVGKTPIVVRDGVGFYTTRVLAAYLGEAHHLVAEGVPVERIDAALTHFGFPVGPLALTDSIGLPVAAALGRALREAFGERMTGPGILETLLAADREGRRSGAGFYRYDDGRRAADPVVHELLDLPADRGSADTSDDEIAWRCVLPLINEAIRCLEEEVLTSPRDGDIGAVLGLGFPAFRGGPFRTVDQLGPGPILGRMAELRRTAGERFRPAQTLVRPGLRFYPAALSRA